MNNTSVRFHSLQNLLFTLIYANLCLSKTTLFSESGSRQRFENRFNQTCRKYPFVNDFVRNLENPSRRYVIFVYHETGQGNTGGLGDRLGGMVSAIAFALRTNRTLLISADKAFEDAFQPYQMNNHVGKYKWGNWDWAGWDRSFSGNMTYLKLCVNPKPSAFNCQLDDDYPEQVVKYRSNRAFLCRWVTKNDLYIKSELNRMGITKETDLFEVAGCMLRLAMWPTERLWRALDKSLEPQLRHRERIGLSGSTSYQIGFHFRCGDNSFTQQKSRTSGSLTHNPECYYDPKVPWKGTNFMDDKSMDSPVDAASCGRYILGNLSVSERNNAMVYIASDNPDSSQQINRTIAWPYVVKPPKVCHVDIQASFDCSLTTTLHWFMLSLSDKIVMQEMIKPIIGSGSLFEDLPPEDNSPRIPPQPGAISGFSRFASIYALDKDVIRYGRSCKSIDKSLLAKETQGNWLCNPKYLY